MSSISFNFDTLEDLVDQLTVFVCDATRKAEQVETCRAGEPNPETAPKAEKAKADEPKRRGRPLKAEEEPKADDRNENGKRAALVELVAAIRAFVIADKIGNMKKLIPLMPAGKKSLDALELEEAQRIVLALGLEV